jgi:hypothetical protein
VVISAPSAEQNTALIDGTLSADDVKQSLGLTGTSSKDTESGEEGRENNSTEDTEEPEGTAISAGTTESGGEVTAQDLMNQCVAELYSYQIDLEVQLGQMKQNALAQWSALSSEERTAAKKQEIGLSGLSKCYALESSTDAAVKGMLQSYRTQFEEIGADSSQLDQLWTYYCEEKESLKAFYLNKYLN